METSYKRRRTFLPPSRVGKRSNLLMSGDLLKMRLYHDVPANLVGIRPSGSLVRRAVMIFCLSQNLPKAWRLLYKNTSFISPSSKVFVSCSVGKGCFHVDRISIPTGVAKRKKKKSCHINPRGSSNFLAS